ncbi:hypothetical protein [Mesorhizobium sp. M8A.F.Ca.ET.165.01.1.1]|uniref:hypothetical protein n=1 Tax=Mesorhizobium sp. M8A.F.Ca.ET.165.01.1.1 TaxID=2563960 RepID=UPI0010939AC2|nr:hypothetical protein [Mesorhizobium sp. M8A.F.Ca.ET.165.01.1.1]TGT35775.1 hypothetical protein EN808_31550 [Mesorhizobium sp. M8A.F.Ca.ET.165.01.1.1]
MAGRQRVIDQAQKLELLQRMKAGETVSKLADEVASVANDFTSGVIIVSGAPRHLLPKSS